MNYLLDCKLLRNRFFAMRHGESEANRLGLIISSPEVGTTGYGLSDHGRIQVLDSVATDTQLDADTLIYSSDFKRAMETAQIVHHQLDCHYSIETRSALRERFFGDFEASGQKNYEQVWQADEINASHTQHHVEAAKAVMARITNLVRELDQSHNDCKILLVAHGDILQILQTAFLKQPAERHRSQQHLNTAEIRELTFLSAS